MTDHDYDFGYGEVYRHSVYRADEISRARAEPGLYAWYIRTPRSECAEDRWDPYRKVFAEKRFAVSASAPLGERLIGRLDRQQLDIGPPKDGTTLDDALFAGTFAAFAPPIYIGRSKSIQKRLSQHVAALEKALDGPPPVAPVTTVDADSPEESSQFGSRVGALLRARGVSDYRGLFVKVVYAPTNDATKRVEFLLNRTFHPTLGRL